MLWNRPIELLENTCRRIGSIQLLSTVDPFRHGKTRGADWPPLLLVP